MNKARRHELKMLRYKRRLRKYGLKESVSSNLFSYRSHGAPCSCSFCSHTKYNRAKAKASLKQDGFIELTSEYLALHRNPNYAYLA